MSLRSHVIVPLGFLVGASLSGGAVRAAPPSGAAPPAAAPASAAPASPAVDAPATPPAPEAAPAPAALPPADPALAALKQQLDDLKRDFDAQKALVEAGAAGGVVESAAKENVLRIYGWADMGIGKAWFQPHDPINGFQPPTNWNFAVGNINLYFDFQPTDKWSSLVEVRFTNIPDGDDAAGFPGVPGFAATPYNRTSTQYNDFGATIPWSYVHLGGIVLERAQIQYRWSDALQFRIGQFLTPFGIWNVDHGTPTLIALGLPVFMVQQLFPTTQIGLQALGNVQVQDWDLGYVFYVSNGRTPAAIDYTADKAFGGRVYGRTSHPYRLQVGLSGFTGRYSDTQRNVTNFFPYTIQSTEVVAYREIDVGADISLDIGPLRIRSELSRGQYVYEQGKRPWDFLAPIPGAQVADSVQLDWYALVAYRLPVWNLEPYFYFEYFKWPTGLGDGYIAPSAGLNVYFTPAAQLRFQYIQNFFYKDMSNFTRQPDYDKKVFMARVVLGF